MHPLKSQLSEAARERKVCGRSLRLLRGGSSRGAGEGKKRERPRNGCSGVKKFPRCRGGGRLTGKREGRDEVKPSAPGEC